MKKYTVDIHTSTVSDGNMSPRFGDAASVQKNCDAFLLKCGVAESHLVMLSVSHGDDVRDVSLQTFGAFANPHGITVDAEALVTKEGGVTLFLLTADCIPAVVFDAACGVVALAHLGWRPTVLGLMEKTIQHMERTYGSRAEDLAVYLGPSIQAPSYAFSEVTQDTPAWKQYLHLDSNGQIHVDLPAYVQSECIRLGVRGNAVHLSDIDTATDAHYFSHSRSKQTGAVEGRFATIVTLRYANEA